MTEGPLQNDKPMCVRVWLEVGHACEPRRSALGRALALDWRVWVRGVSGSDISAFVHKVVFHLHPASAFVYPKRVIQEPPYEIQESGCASIEIPIHVYLKHSSKPRRIRLRYALRVESGARQGSESRCVYYDVENPPEPLWRALLLAGGQVLARADRRLLALLDMKPAPPPYAFVAPLPEPARRPPPAAAAAAAKRRPADECAPCAKELRRQLRAADMTRCEAAQAQALAAALARYARAPDALPLPPAGDPIYRVPELPAALRAAASSVEADLTRL